MKVGTLFVSVVISILLGSPVSAHPGGTDGFGGHTNHSTGEYHYHHGYSAHQHTDGVCPYDFDDRTGWNSGPTPGSGQSGNRTANSSSMTRQDFSVVQDVEKVSVIDRVISALRKWAKNAVQSTLLPKLKNSLLIFLAGAVFFLHVGWPIYLPIVLVLRQQRRKKKQELRNRRVDVVNCLQQVLLQKQAEEETRRAELEAFLEQLRLRRIQEQEERRKRLIREQEDFHKKRLHYQSLFEGKTNLELAGAPPNIEFGSDNLPREKGSAKWGSVFTFYSASNGRAYHRTRGCSNARIPIHALDARLLQPCKRCKPSLPDMEWYSRYLKIKQIKGAYGLPDYVPPPQIDPVILKVVLDAWQQVQKNE